MASQLISEFDIWRPGYENAVVSVYLAGTSTLANIFSDEGLTISAPNPQTLLADSEGAGKFTVSLYVGVPYELDINTNETTGIQQIPITSLVGEDASGALVNATGSSQAIALADFIAETVNALNYGILEFGNNAGDASTNTATINAAIGALGNGGEVILPAGIIRVLQLTIPATVVLRGQGRGVTILMSILGDKSFLLAGAGGGFRNLTLDGNIQSVNSIGVYGVAMNSIVFDNVNIQNFKIGLYFKGGSLNYWRNLDIMSCDVGANLIGDLDAGNTNDGTDFLWNVWNGGHVYACDTTAIYLSYHDKKCSNFAFRDVFFDSSVTDGVLLNGAQFVAFDECRWEGNHINFRCQDDTTVLKGAAVNDNVVIDVQFRGGRMNGGQFNITGTAQDIVLRAVEILGVTFNLNTPVDNQIILQDCFEDSNVVIAGEGTKLLRDHTVNHGYTTGRTTSDVATTAWSLPMQSGQVVHVHAQIVGQQINGLNNGIFDISFGAVMSGATLNYVTQTAIFVLGDILTGASSGATARILFATNSGASGLLTLSHVTGTFLDSEILTGSSGGSATANGGVTAGSISVDSVGTTFLRAAYHSDTNWTVAAVAGVSDILIQVTGDTSQTVDWNVKVDVVSS